MKSSVADLILAYKQHENLYNQKNKLYYNKQARNLSLKKIWDAVKVKELKAFNWFQNQLWLMYF